MHAQCSTQVGSVLDEARKIYVVKDVVAIPLSGLQEATSIISTVARSNAALARLSLLVSPFQEQPRSDAGPSEEAGMHVKFADGHEVKVMTPSTVDESSTLDRPPSPASVASSVASSVSSGFATAPVAKALVNRLSFWNSVSRKNSIKASAVESPVAEEEAQPLDALIHEGMPEPQQVLSEIIETAAPPPATIKEKYTELEAKILRQTVKEFTKGEMYFAYDFGRGTPILCSCSVHQRGPRHNAFLTTQAGPDCQNSAAKCSARGAQCLRPIGPVRGQWRGRRCSGRASTDPSIMASGRPTILVE